MASQPETKRRRIYISATVDDFERAGKEILRRDPECRTNTKTFHRRWMALFGVTPKTCAKVWSLLHVTEDDDSYRGAKHFHLLWALLFLRVYGSEEEAAVLCGGVDEGTYRYWSQLFVQRIADLILDVVSTRRRAGSVTTINT